MTNFWPVITGGKDSPNFDHLNRTGESMASQKLGIRRDLGISVFLLLERTKQLENCTTLASHVV